MLENLESFTNNSHSKIIPKKNSEYLRLTFSYNFSHIIHFLLIPVLNLLDKSDLLYIHDIYLHPYEFNFFTYTNHYYNHNKKIHFDA